MLKKKLNLLCDFRLISVANRVVDKHTFTLSGCQLTAERFHGLKPEADQINNNGTPTEEAQATQNMDEQPQGKPQVKVEEALPKPKPVEERVIPDDREMSPEGSSCDESELQSCTIEVGGVNKNTSQEAVKRFFETRRRSGGGKVNDIWFNKETGNYIITFQLREGEPIESNKVTISNSFHEAYW